MQISSNTIFDSLKGTLDHLISSESLTHQVSTDEALIDYVVPVLIDNLRDRGVPLLTMKDVDNLEQIVKDMKLENTVRSVLLEFINTLKGFMINEDNNNE